MFFHFKKMWSKAKYEYIKAINRVNWTFLLKAFSFYWWIAY